MSQPLRNLRRQRDSGRRRVAVVTASSAAGATALAVTFGAVLAAGQPPSASSTPSAPVNVPIQPVDNSLDVHKYHRAAAPAPAVTPTPAPKPAQNAVQKAVQKAVPPATTAREPLKPPAQAPKPAPKQTAQAPSGAS